MDGEVGSSFFFSLLRHSFTYLKICHVFIISFCVLPLFSRINLPISPNPSCKKGALWPSVHVLLLYRTPSHWHDLLNSSASLPALLQWRWSTFAWHHGQPRALLNRRLCLFFSSAFSSGGPYFAWNIITKLGNPFSADTYWIGNGLAMPVSSWKDCFKFPVYSTYIYFSMKVLYIIIFLQWGREGAFTSIVLLYMEQ